MTRSFFLLKKIYVVREKLGKLSRLIAYIYIAVRGDSSSGEYIKILKS